MHDLKADQNQENRLEKSLTCPLIPAARHALAAVDAPVFSTITEPLAAATGAAAAHIFPLFRSLLGPAGARLAEANAHAAFPKLEVEPTGIVADAVQPSDNIVGRTRGSYSACSTCSTWWSCS